MLVYLAGAVGHRPSDAEEFKRKALDVPARPSKEYSQAIDRMLELVESADPSHGDGYRQRLLGLARDHKVVSGYSPEYPLNAAKSAILTALDYR
jgi:hypothetical protein